MGVVEQGMALSGDDAWAGCGLSRMWAWGRNG